MPIAKKRKKANKILPRRTDEHLPPYSGPYDTIQKQIYYEYNLAWNFMRPKIQKWLIRLKLYNNQRKDEDRVGEPLVYETHQTVMSLLYGDRLETEFAPRLEGEQDQADNLNILKDNDEEEMEKDKLDYDWDWDAGFFGRGLCLMNDFDLESKTPIPTIIDPTTFIRNPGAKSVNGNRHGEGQMLFGGYEVRLTESMMKSNLRTEKNPNGYFNLDKLLRTNDLFSLSGEGERLRREAQGLNDIYTFENAVIENYEYRVLRWFTHIPDENGISSKYIVEIANNRMLPIRVIKLEKKFWPIIDRVFSPIAHDWDGVSIPDLVEDKQRFKAKMLNLAGDTAMADLNGMYLFHEDRFRKTQDFNFKFNKWIPVRGAGALGDAAMPLRTREVSNSVKYVLDYLTQSAQRATGTDSLMQGGQPKGDNTLGETQIQVSAGNMKHSLTAKIFGWSEKEFWKHWYFVYDENFSDSLGEKMATLQGAFHPEYIPIKRSSIITGNTLGPKIRVVSKMVSEAQKLNEFKMLQGYVQMVVIDPAINSDKTYIYRKMGKLIMPKNEVERMIPLSIDEYQALEENKSLNDNKMPRVTIEQNHQVHLRVHDSADDTPATKRHIQIHMHMLMQKRQNPTAFPPMPGEQPTGATTPSQTPQVTNPIQSVGAPTPNKVGITPGGV